jgi:hypothetical protein
MLARRLVCVPLLLVACAPQREAGPHAEAVQQQSVEPACGGDTAPASSLGLVVTTSFEQETRAHSKITNRGPVARLVALDNVSICAGPCAGYFAECDVRRSFQDPEQGPAYAVTLAPGEAIGLDVDARLMERSSSCEKVGVIVVMDVDGTRACAELGRYIALTD